MSAEKGSVHMAIEVRPDGSIFVAGPLKNKDLCMRLLIDAMLVVLNRKEEEPLVKPVSLIIE